MINRKVLYGYQIQNGTLEIVPEEQRAVSMVFTLYNAGASYQAISDALNRQGIPYCREVPLWNKHKVKRLLENPRYTGKEEYPILVEADIFQAAQEKTAEKNARKQSHGEKPAIARLRRRPEVSDCKDRQSDAMLCARCALPRKEDSLREALRRFERTIPSFRTERGNRRLSFSMRSHGG